MKEDVFLLVAAVVAIVCCLGASLIAAAGGMALLGLAGLAPPAAALGGVAIWIAWYVMRRRKEPTR